MYTQLNTCSEHKGGKEAAIMRGPIATRVINQLVGSTEWGNLDYLVR